MSTTSLNSLTSFDQWCDVFVREGLMNSPGEFHGMVTGRVCSGAELNDAEVASLLDVLERSENGSHEVVSSLIEALWAITARDLSESNFGFQLLLPDEGFSLVQRSAELGRWCQGFLLGLVLGEKAVEYSDDTQEVIRDLSAIAQIAADNEEQAEGTESDFFEVSEYVRLAAINVFLEGTQTSSANVGNDTNPPVIH